MSERTTLEVLVAIATLVVATFVTRAGMLLVGDRLKLSHHVESALRFAPACALAALVLPETLGPTGVIDLSLANPRWPAAVAAITFLLRRDSVLGGIAVGMAAYGIVRFVIG